MSFQISNLFAFPKCQNLKKGTVSSTINSFGKAYIRKGFMQEPKSPVELTLKSYLYDYAIQSSLVL